MTLYERRTSLLRNLSRAAEMFEQDEAKLAAINKVEALVTCGQLGPFGNTPMLPNWLYLGIAESLDSPKKVSWADVEEHEFDNDKRKRAKWSTFLGKMRHQYNIDLSDSEIALFSEVIGTMLTEKQFTHEVVSGEELRHGYDSEHFDSCMSVLGNYYKGQTEFYVRNPQKVELLKVYQEGNFVARALVWNTDNGERVLDRVYPVDDHSAATKYAKDVAKQKGWDYRMFGHTSAPELVSGDIHRITMKNVGYYPYVDTFLNTHVHWEDRHKHYTKQDELILCNTRLYENGHTLFIGTMDNVDNRMDADNDEDYFTCPYTDEVTHNDDGVYVSSTNEMVSHDALHEYFVEINGEWYHTERGDVVFSEYHGEHLLRHDSLHSSMMDDYIPDDSCAVGMWNTELQDWDTVDVDWLHQYHNDPVEITHNRFVSSLELVVEREDGKLYVENSSEYQLQRFKGTELRRVGGWDIPTPETEQELAHA